MTNSIGCADLTCCDKLKASVNPKLVCFRRLLAWLLWERTLNTWWHDNYIRIKHQNKISENQNQERPLHLHFLAFKYVLKSTSDSLCHSLPIWRSTPQPFGCRRSLTAQSILWQICSGTVNMFWDLQQAETTREAWGCFKWTGGIWCGLYFPNVFCRLAIRSVTESQI